MNDMFDVHFEVDGRERFDFFDIYSKILRLHSHSCEKSNLRCQKRKDLEGNTVCRTPPNPQSHCHWVLNIEQQYPEDVLQYIVEIGSASRGINGYVQVNYNMRCRKQMYAATEGEHLLPTCTALYGLTRSSTNLLLVLKGKMCPSYVVA